MIAVYVMLLGIALVLVGAGEFISPVSLYRFWTGIIYGKYFRLYGLFLIAAGFPLTAYSGTFSGIIFFTGIFLVLFGPFILVYPEKIQNTVREASAEMDHRSIRMIVYADAAIRTLLGILFVLSYIMNSRI